ncbi:bifunctional glutamate N-acetyltransferase/amino-acid acetyltransferase ArgJ [Paeniglutamicibacter sulfureus]|uniref:bifunctional glutamate N-acetyltransferase/amino-acid acetyltransferase ArgJ n=1 Tax=Paeniglutamicibacter sulfureus TaxID=43666 RepID=UPI002666F011|nr:bifunctional glutamate N-acetyltransferase/amino-acid acetyltransferase ArgJ [Paeniglutamicibacter sulfureus]MDO2932849.1 bifunctional glutamate N-acetyltransferase/amino-acid acetyltransferase ArgJ [Paeniglutamicibacter sulfureus]
MGITYPGGFSASGITAGLKASGNPDLALVRNNGPRFDAAAVFTSNRVAAAPVHWSRQVISDGRADAVVLNSGGANACTGPEGFANTHATAEHVATVLGVSSGDVLVCSTGLIGEQLPMDKILPGVDAAAAALGSGNEFDGGAAAATAIMTTDTVSKQAGFAGSGYSIGAMAKGAGMLAPGLATMLVVITTDAVLEPAQLDDALREATRVSFDRADSDGCMSTNDTVILMSSGASETVPDTAEFTAGLTEVCVGLAKALISDAEGAAHEITIRTFNAATEDDAVEVSRTVARSNLFKTAIFGQDPNWGRVLSAVGTTRAAFEPDELNVSINGVQVCRKGGVGDDRNLVDLSGRNVLVEIDLNAGMQEASLWTNDLTHDYVHENSAYSS